MMSLASDNMTRSAFSMFDIMLSVQRMGLRAMTMYQPSALNLFESPKSSQTVGVGRARDGHAVMPGANEEQVIAVGEEVLNVGTRMVQGKTTKLRRVVVEAPVQQDVTLHTETVVLERRRPVSTSGADVLTEVTVEMSDFNEIPVVSKSVHLVEEVLLRREVTARTETIHDTVKRDKVEIDQPSQLPVVFDGAANREDKRQADSASEREQSMVAAEPDKKSGSVVAVESEKKAGGQKR